MVKEDESVKAMDVRTKLAKVCKKTKVLQRFINGTDTLHDAYQTLVDSGSEGQAFQKIKRFNEWFGSAAADKEIRKSSGSDRARIVIELGKLSKTLTKLNQIIKASRTR